MGKRVFVVILLIFVLGFVYAQPQTTVVVTEEGYLIEIPQTIDVIKRGVDYHLHAHVLNESTGFIITNETASCDLHLYNSTGNHILKKGLGFEPPFDFELIIDGGNFSESGEYSYILTCNSSIKGGFVADRFEVNPSGEDLGTDEALIYILLTLAVLLLFLLSLYFTLITPYSNEISEKGAVIKVTKTKYIKLGLILLSYVLFVWLLNVLIGVADNFVGLTMYYGFVSFLFLTLNNLAIPLGIFILVLSLFEIIRDANIQEAISKFGSAKK